MVKLINSRNSLNNFFDHYPVDSGSASTKKDGKLVSEISVTQSNCSLCYVCRPILLSSYLRCNVNDRYIPSWLLNHILANFFLCFYLRESYFIGVFYLVSKFSLIIYISIYFLRTLTSYMTIAFMYVTYHTWMQDIIISE